MLLQIVLSLFALWLTRAVWYRWRFDLHKIPSPRGWPFIGNALELIGKHENGGIPRVRAAWFKQLGYPDVLKFSIGRVTIVVVRNAEFLKTVVLSKTKTLPRPSVFVSGFITFTGNDPSVDSFINQGDVTPYIKEVRKMYARAFQSHQLKITLPQVQRIINKMLSKIEIKRVSGPVDFQKLCVQLTLDVIGEVAFQMNLGGLDEESGLLQSILDVGHVLAERNWNMLTNLHRKLIPNSSVKKRQENAINVLVAQWDALTNKVLQFDDPSEGEEPLWHCLKTMKRPDTGKKLEFNELRSELAFTVVAGMDSTGHQLAWILALLASHPHVVDKLLEELRAHGLYGKDARDLQFEDLGELSYLAAIIKEGMRIATTVIGAFPRAAPADMEIMGYRVPKGTIIMTPGNRWLDSEEEWGDPDVFRPERWLEDEDLSNRWFLGFSHGARDCVGQKLAMLELRTGIIEVIKTYQLSLTVPIKHLMERSKLGLVIEATDGIWMNVIPRE